MKVALILLGLTLPAAAQMFGIQGDGTIMGDWQTIEDCAAKPFPGLNWDDPETREIGNTKFNQIEVCRSMLAARHAGWIAAGGDPGADPYMPQPMSRLGEDFKKKLICDYTKLDKNRMGVVSCNDD